MSRSVESTVAKAASRGTRRLIEEWLPIAEIGIEALRERTPMTPFPAPNRLHVWWARRPLVASRAAVLASLLPADADHKKFLHALGIHGDPVAAKARMVAAGKNIDPITGKRENLGPNPWGYARAFQHNPSDADRAYLRTLGGTRDLPPKVLDSTAGGGSIPHEALRLGCDTYGNDLNPVAWLILKATVEFPAKFGDKLLKRYQQLSKQFVEKASKRFIGIFPPEPDGVTVDGYLWARTVHCPYCAGLVPLSPNWKLNNKGVGVRLVPGERGKAKGERDKANGERDKANGESPKPDPFLSPLPLPLSPEASPEASPRVCTFEIVHDAAHQSVGTVKGGDGLCPFPDCGRVIDGDEIKAQAKAGQMGEQLYAVVYTERKVVGYTKAGKPKLKKTRGFRAPRPQDDNAQQVQTALDDKMPEWLARGIVPDEERYIGPADRSGLYGVATFQNMFSPRQLLGHGTSVEVFHDLLAELGGAGKVSEVDKAALIYLALGIDKLLNYNARMVRWHANREVVAGVFDRHDFAFLWSYAEMAPCVTGLGYDWAIKQTGKSLEELIELSGKDDESDDDESLTFKRQSGDENEQSEITLSQGSGDHVPHLADASIDAVVLDPPYYDNVMYAELADFFYVWLKRTAGLLFPEQFADHLTDKDREAVANPAKFKGQAKGERGKAKGEEGASPFALSPSPLSAKKRASRDYQERMQAIFAEARRVLKPEGIMTLMFTHKATGAWDALAKGLVDAGFVITASWPIQTEAEGSLHIKDKNAAKSTIFLVCRPRAEAKGEGATAKGDDGTDSSLSSEVYWEDVEPKVKTTVAEKVVKFQEAGIRGVDLYLACFGPALQVFSEFWPMKRGRANQKPLPARGAQLNLLEEEEWDPYAVRPEDALMAARSAVKQWRLQQLTTVRRQAHLDPVTEWYVLAWDAFQSPQFPADEALKLARVVGVNFDEQLRNKVLEIKGGDVIIWDSSQRAKKGVIGSMTGACSLDALHHAAHTVREKNIGIAKDMVERAELHKSNPFLLALEAALNVLPTPKMVSGKGVLAGAATDAESLEKMRKLMFGAEVPQAKAWMLFAE